MLYYIPIALRGRFPFDWLITFYPFERACKAFADARSGRIGKPDLLIAPSAAVAT